MPLSEGVWMVSGGVWMVSGWGLRVSGNVLIPGYQDIAIPNPLAKFKLGHTRILAFLHVPSFAKTSGECLDGVCGSPTVSRSYLGVSGRCLGEYSCHINHK